MNIFLAIPLILSTVDEIPVNHGILVDRIVEVQEKDEEPIHIIRVWSHVYEDEMLAMEDSNYYGSDPDKIKIHRYPVAELIPETIHFLWCLKHGMFEEIVYFPEEIEIQCLD